MPGVAAVAGCTQWCLWLACGPWSRGVRGRDHAAARERTPETDQESGGLPSTLRLMKSDRNRKPTLVLVTGQPGSGKTTLSRVLANALSCPLVSRDEIYEGMRRTFAHDPDPPGKSDVTVAAFDLFFRVMGILVSSNVTLVAEAAFQDERWRIGLEPITPAADLKVIHCVVPAELARQRVLKRRREREDASRAARVGNDSTTDERRSAVRPFVPLLLPVPTIRVATAAGYDPGLDEVIAFLTS